MAFWRNVVIIRERMEAGAYFLDDHNNSGNVMPHNNVFELLEALVRVIGRNHVQHFGP